MFICGSCGKIGDSSELYYDTKCKNLPFENIIKKNGFVRQCCPDCKSTDIYMKHNQTNISSITYEVPKDNTITVSTPSKKVKNSRKKNTKKKENTKKNTGKEVRKFEPNRAQYIFTEKCKSCGKEFQTKTKGSNRCKECLDKLII